MSPIFAFLTTSHFCKLFYCFIFGLLERLEVKHIYLLYSSEYFLRRKQSQNHGIISIYDAASLSILIKERNRKPLPNTAIFSLVCLVACLHVRKTSKRTQKYYISILTKACFFRKSVSNLIFLAILKTIIVKTVIVLFSPLPVKSKNFPGLLFACYQPTQEKRRVNFGQKHFGIR